jgi:hypothetical protein
MGLLPFATLPRRLTAVVAFMGDGGRMTFVDHLGRRLDLESPRLHETIVTVNQSLTKNAWFADRARHDLGASIGAVLRE